MINLQHTFQGNWKSVEEVERLPDYGLDFFRWIGRDGVKGYFIFSVLSEEDKLIAELGIPIGVEEYFFIYQGRFEATKTQIRIWQNEQDPVRIKYHFEGKLLFLQVFSRTVIFRKKE